MLPKRLQDSIEKWFQKDYRATFYERIECLRDSEKMYEDLPYAIRYGKTLEYTLKHISVFIQADEKIVGSIKEIIPTDEQKNYAESLSEAWWGKDLEEIQKDILWFYSYGWLKRRPPWFYSFGHLSLQWDAIVDLGLKAFEDKAVKKLESLEDEEDQTKAEFIEGAILCYQSLSSFIKRYAEEAKVEAAKCEDPIRKKELDQISDSCFHISEHPARTFHEGLQLLWLIILPLQKVAGCGVFNFSRMDQYLYPLYKQDIDSGALTEDQALELIEDFYNKNNDIMSPTDHQSQEIETTQYSVEVAYDDPNYIMLAGKLKDGKPGVNPLSYLFIEAAHELGLRNPWVVVRYYEGIDPVFWKKVIDAMRDNSTVVVYNDETMMPALESYGIDKEDVVDYGFYGCNDPIIPGKEGGLRQLWFNMLRPFELALNAGDYPMQPLGDALTDESCTICLEDRMIGTMTGVIYGIQSEDVAKIENIDQLLDVYRQQVGHMMKAYRRDIEKDILLEKETNKGRMRIEDCFLEGTIENAITWNNGGTKYHKILVQGGGIATVVDGLAAIETLVFRNKEYTLPALVEILNKNFEGEALLQKRLLKKMPKFGNDIEWVDALAEKVGHIFCDEIEKQNGPEYLYQFLPSLSTDRDFVRAGSEVGATPDGRMAGQPMSENQSPSQGMDREGLTALFNSTAKIPFNRITGGPLNVKLHPSAVKGEKGLEAFASAVDTYMKNGGMQVQINVVSKETLLDAQLHPEKYADLCVRVTGYSAFFVQMGLAAQNEMIARSEKH